MVFTFLQFEQFCLFSLFHPFKGGLFFAKPMRDKNYTTMMDPFQRKYGKTLTGLLAVAAFIAEVMWIPGTLISLGLIMMAVFYLLVLGIGIWASVRSKKLRENAQNGQVEFSFLANRSVNLIVGVFTMTATWVGGGFTMGFTETVYDPTKGLIWALFPLQLSISFIIGGLFFAKPMRDKNYTTMMDPFQRKYGKTLTGLLAVAAFISEVVYIPVTLISLGVTVRIFSDLPLSLCIWISAAVAIIYTVLGGLYSVAYTDVVQLLLVFCGLWLCAPFVLASDVYTDITQTAVNHTYQAPWLGHIESHEAWTWVDNFLVLTLGNLAFQDFHQGLSPPAPHLQPRLIVS
ncbi:high affinity choline transporter 1 [Larimichthys crocea]|uniref:high affinity choline transporter 1 n=1 Tax=Larimichthys crocea TaxID=215358 RepID=UPI000F5F8CD1|nr:high affinity choline transporter 1 [Larimichthys crocea]